MTNTLAFDLIDIIKTKEDKQQFLKHLEELSQSFFSKENNLESLLEQVIPYGKRQKILHLAHTQHIDVTSTQTMQAFIEELRSSTASLPEITLTLAVEPTHGMINTISSWFVTHLKKPLVLDIVVNKKLIGGVILGYQGMYKDFSVKKKLVELYEKGELKLR